jgi:DNA-binding response OmpR family regulator
LLSIGVPVRVLPFGAKAVTHALIIEDNPLIAFMVQDRLTARGYDPVAIATTQAKRFSWRNSAAPI